MGNFVLEFHKRLPIGSKGRALPTLTTVGGSDLKAVIEAAQSAIRDGDADEVLIHVATFRLTAEHPYPVFIEAKP